MMPSPSADQLPYFGPLLDHSEDAIVACDAGWRVTVWNEGARRMYGWTAEEAVGRPATLLGLGESDAQRMDRRRELAEHGRWRGEMTVVRKDGSEVPVESVVVAIRDEQGGVSGYVAIHRDITERKRAEEALRAANGRTEAILQRLRDTFFAVDDRWRYTYVNERAVATASKAWGREVSAEELLGKNCWELFPETAGTAFDRELHRAVREQRVVEFEAYSLATDAWVEVRAYPSSDGLSVYSRDVTARRRGREALAYHASLLNNVDDGVIATDADDFRITAWNKGAERLYGFRAEEVLGRPAREVASYPSDEARHKLEHELLETGRTRIEFTAHRNDGTPIEVELIAAEVRNDRRQLTGYLGIHRDITERKRAEEALREANSRNETILESITDDFVAVDHDWRYTYINDRALRSTQEWLGWPISREELLGRTLWEVLPETVGTVPYVQYHQAVRDGHPVEFESYFDAHDSWFETHVYPSKSGLSIYFRTITERKRAAEQLERRIRQQAAVAELGVRALADGRLQPLMDQAVRLVCGTLGVEFAKVDELLPEREGLLVSAGAGWREGVVGSCVLPADRRSPAGYALSVGAPVIADDMSAETRFEVPAVLSEHAVMSYITVVIDPPGAPFGTLAAASRQRRTFTEDDVSFVQAVANVLATAVERTRSDERLEAAREAERGRIARDLHDEALQGLGDAIALVALADRSPLEQRLTGELLPVLRLVSEQLRFAIYDLRLESEEHLAFVELLERLVDEHRAMMADRKIQLEMGDGIPTGSLGAKGIEMLRILGEALTNARRHAQARHVHVRVWGTNDGLSAEVSDDGRGFDTESPASPIHRGITSMRERAELLNARLEIQSEPGVGTTVRLEAPLANGTSGDT